MSDLLKQYKTLEAKHPPQSKTSIEARWLDQAKHDAARKSQ